MAETNQVGKVRDVVCGMDIDPRYAEAKLNYQGQTFHFCSQGCKEEFDRKPEEYSKKKAQLFA